MSYVEPIPCPAAEAALRARYPHVKAIRVHRVKLMCGDCAWTQQTEFLGSYEVLRELVPEIVFRRRRWGGMWRDEYGESWSAELETDGRWRARHHIRLDAAEQPEGVRAWPSKSLQSQVARLCQHVSRPRVRK